MNPQPATSSRAASLAAASNPDEAIVDLLVVGGGINGTGIARDAAGRGLRVVLCEKDDLAQGTSSRSSGLIHGGLRYLEYGEFGLVRESLRERELLLGIAPHLVRPQTFVLPHVAGMRPAWLLRLGLFVYDHLGGASRLDPSRALRLRDCAEGAPLQPACTRGFRYTDCRTDDARLVLHNALGAAARGATILTGTELLAAQPRAGAWDAVLRGRDGQSRRLRARVLVNAAGPWVGALAQHLPVAQRGRALRLVKGSHIVVPRFWDGEQAYLLQNPDRRVIFVTPYEDCYAMIGTTDVPYVGAPEAVAISAEESAYLCAAVNRHMRCTLSPADVRYAYAGVRALVDDAQADPAAVTRDYLLELSSPPDHAPLLTVLGGKITTFRRLAEQALEKLRSHVPAMGPAWTATAPLPGGDIGDGGLPEARARLAEAAPFLPGTHADGLFARHGTRALAVLGAARRLEDLGQHFGAGFYEAEARHFRAHEWAVTAEDMLWRRSKFGLRLAPAEQERFRDWLAASGVS